MDTPSDGASEQAPRWDLMDTGSYSSRIRVLAPYLIIWGYIVYIGGRSTSVEQQGAHEGGGRAWGEQVRPPTSWPHVSWLDIGSKSPELHSLRKSRSRRFHSVWTPFDIPFFETLKQAKNSNSGLGLRLIG